jgi:hypothetical protein
MVWPPRPQHRVRKHGGRVGFGLCARVQTITRSLSLSIKNASTWANSQTPRGDTCVTKKTAAADARGRGRKHNTRRTTHSVQGEGTRLSTSSLRRCSGLLLLPLLLQHAQGLQDGEGGLVLVEGVEVQAGSASINEAAAQRHTKVLAKLLELLLVVLQSGCESVRVCGWV